MYDKIKISLKAEPSTKNYLTHLGVHLFKNSDCEFYTGKIGTLKVRINGEYKMTIEGSLSKYYLGNNIDLFHTDKIDSAFDKLSQEINLDLKTAVVSSLEFGRCFNMNEPIPYYLEELGDSKNYKECGRYSSSLTYRKTNRKLLIYDKIKEMKSKRQKIPSHITHPYILRIENAYLNNVSNQLKENTITVQTLKNQGFQEKLLKLLFDDYSSISDKNIFRIRKGFEPKNPSELKIMLMQLGIKQIGGALKCKREVDRIRNNMIKNKKYNMSMNTSLNRMKSLINKIDSNQDYFESSNSSLELNRKMIDALDEFWYSGGR